MIKVTQLLTYILGLLLDRQKVSAPLFDDPWPCRLNVGLKLVSDLVITVLAKVVFTYCIMSVYFLVLEIFNLNCCGFSMKTIHLLNWVGFGLTLAEFGLNSRN